MSTIARHHYFGYLDYLHYLYRLIGRESMNLLQGAGDNVEIRWN